MFFRGFGGAEFVLTSMGLFRRIPSRSIKFTKNDAGEDKYVTFNFINKGCILLILIKYNKLLD